MRIHALQTGTVTVRRSQLRAESPIWLRRLRVLLDQSWTAPLPILAWAIEHPEGVIVVDTGETARARDAGYWPRWHPYYRRAVRVDVEPEEEIGPQLSRCGIEPRDVAAVVLTHLHTDHAGGLHHFRHSRIVVRDVEYADACGFVGMLRGYLPHRWPSWLEPDIIHLDGRPLGPFASSVPLTRAGDVVAVATPGHTRGHLSVIVMDGEQSVFLAGDVTYSEQATLAGTVDGVCTGPAAYRRSLAAVRRYLRTVPTVFLPTHDPGAVRRLRDRVPTRPTGPDVPS